MAGAPQLIRHPGIQQQRINHTRIASGAAQVVGMTDPQRLPQLQRGPQGTAQLQTALRALGTVQLHDAVASLINRKLRQRPVILPVVVEV